MKTEISKEIKSKRTLPTDSEKIENIYQNSEVENFCNDYDSDFNTKLEFSSNISPSLQFNLSDLDFNDDRKKLNIQNLNLISLGQYNFKHFNPSLGKRESLINHRIKKLEESVLRNSEDDPSKIYFRSGDRIERVNLKAKLAFWENVYKRNQKETQEKKVQIDDIGKFITEMNNLQKESPLNGLLEKERILKSSDSEQKEGGNDILLTGSDLLQEVDNSSETHNEVTSNKEKFIENKFNSEMISTPKSKRSFSDPGILERGCHETCSVTRSPKTSFCEFNQTSSTDNLSTSIDVESSFEDDALSSTDHLISTEDEYIDDEIPDDSLFTYWGDLSLMKSMKTANLSTYKEYCHYIDSEILKNQYQCANSCPSECKVFGIGAYFGYVAVKNQFQVLTKDAGNGNLSVSVQGFGKHDVGFVSVKYKNKDIYEVTYQVMRPGLYLISLRWMENPIVGSPFLCKITF